MSDLSRAVWRKAAASHANGGCDEIAANLGPVIAVRAVTRPSQTAAARPCRTRNPPSSHPRGDSF
jgi:hypothetical protein